ncbi:MAG: lysylphosphatidylglycerol synthase transmembrane domain-containing protein [Myxococcales bacterium]|nr:lysylphosphatidylglycerol synthase transmembrane domain-containing protein [Myxococcales bacterium]MDD9965907.1 lysylphosphatidylglycerol synthase transmembrane domain-containing protein [Myxococcales bacterium]
MTDEHTQVAEATRGLARKVTLAAAFGALIFAGLALYSDVPKMRAAVVGFAPQAFVAGLALAAGNYVLRIVRWHYYLLQLNISIPRRESALVFLSGFVMSVTPGKIGEVLKSILLLESRGVPLTRTAPIVVAERLTDLMALVLLTALGALTFDHGVLIAGAGAAIVLMLLGFCSYAPLGHAALRVAERVPLVRRVAGKLWLAYDALLAMTRPGPLLWATLLSFVAWGMECASLYFIVHGFSDVHMAWDAATFAYAASTIIGALAMMPGGLGVTEVGMAGLVQALGAGSMTPAVAGATTILVRVATLWFAVVVGAVAMPLHRAMYIRPAVEEIS